MKEIIHEKPKDVVYSSNIDDDFLYKHIIIAVQDNTFITFLKKIYQFDKLFYKWFTVDQCNVESPRHGLFDTAIDAIDIMIDHGYKIYALEPHTDPCTLGLGK